jgi:antitoxin (DNA-binding transcriptional repressor) of toxin-antitoxin stability system
MSVATLQQIGQDLPSWVALVQHGETIVITQAGKTVARLMPPEDGVTG